jgi:putative selenium metabolism hydrolase
MKGDAMPWEFPEKELIEFTRQIIRVPSLPGEEAEVARMVADKMEQMGYDEVSIDEKHSVLGKLAGSGEGKSLILNGHIDHVEVGSMKDAYSAAVLDGDVVNYDGKIIWGRGSVDMKSAVAAMVVAAGAVKRRNIPLKGDVWVLANSLEEPARGEGILNVLENNGLRADMAVVCEPSNLGIRIGQTGRMDLKVIAKGIQCHSSYPEKGKNAIYEMSRFIQAFQSRYTIPEHPIFGKLPFAAIQISSPVTNLPTVPDCCEILINRRFTHEENKDSVTATFEALIESIKAEDPEFDAEVEYLGEFPPFYCDPQEAIVTLLKEATHKVMGKETDIGTWTFGTEAGFLMKYGIASVGFGPGIPSAAHTENEFVPVDHVITASKVYAEVIRLANR